MKSEIAIIAAMLPVMSCSFLKNPQERQALEQAIEDDATIYYKLKKAQEAKNDPTAPIPPSIDHLT